MDSFRSSFRKTSIAHTSAGLAAVSCLMAMAMAAASCSTTPKPRTDHKESASMETNPFFTQWSTPYGVPPFDDIKEEHFLPAIERGIAEQRQEIDQIASNPAPADFTNTLEALDASGQSLERTLLVFYNLFSAETTAGLQAIAQQAMPMTASLQDDIYLNATLFARIEAVYDGRADLELDQEAMRLVEETYKRFVRGGALLGEEQQTRLRQINQDLSLLGLQFSDNVLAETNAYKLVIEDPQELVGLTPSLVAAAARAANEAGLESAEEDGPWLFSLHGPSLWPFLQQSANRGLREKMQQAYARRGDQDNEHDNKEILTRMASLRAEKAALLGYPSWSHFILEDRMAGEPRQVMSLLGQLWEPALEVARQEEEALAQAIRDVGEDHPVTPWDWHYYTERVRKQSFGIDDAQLRPYFSLPNVLEGSFEVAKRLFGIEFHQVHDVPVYHPEVQVYEVKDKDGSYLGLFLADYHPRAGKRGGAWASTFRTQRQDPAGNRIAPIVTNVGNFTRPSGDDKPALLSIEEVETLFHELGHALHSLFSDYRYRSLGSVPRDFVEVPSQIMENWVLEPEVLKLYARHYQTGEVIPMELVESITAARQFNQGFATVEYLAASYLDMAWHLLEAPVEVQDPTPFEQEEMDRIELMSSIIPRYRSTYFSHIFAGAGGYSAGYYSYIWSEVLDADAFAAFKEKGLFDRATAESFRNEILQRGGTMDAMEMYKNFRGREPEVTPLLERRGLL